MRIVSQKLSLTINEFTVIQVNYQFNGPSGGVYTIVKEGSNGGTFEETVEQAPEIPDAPLRLFYTFEIGA